MDPTTLVGKVIVDLGRKAAGKVAKVWEAGTYASKVNNRPVLGQVLELETGDTFVWKDDGAWQVLDAEKGEKLYEKARQVAAMGAMMLGKDARELEVDQATALLVIGRAYQLQGGKLLGGDDKGEGWR